MKVCLLFLKCSSQQFTIWTSEHKLKANCWIIVISFWHPSASCSSLRPDVCIVPVGDLAQSGPLLHSWTLHSCPELFSLLVTKARDLKSPVCVYPRVVWQDNEFSLSEQNSVSDSFLKPCEKEKKNNKCTGRFTPWVYTPHSRDSNAPLRLSQKKWYVS